MLVGMVDLNTGKSPKFAGFRIWFRNFKDRLFDSKYIRNRSVLKCFNCGSLLVPCVENYGPRDCDWHKTKKGWCCHTCYNPYEESLCCDMTYPYMKDYFEGVESRNKRVLEKVKQYNEINPRKKIKINGI